MRRYPERSNRILLPSRDRKVRELPARELPPRERSRPSQTVLSPLRSSEETALWDIGRFRVVSFGALAEFRYDGDRKAALRDVSRLRKEGLLEQQNCPGKWMALTLTNKGHSQMALRHQGGGQLFHAGIARQSDIEHDAALYPMYVQELGELRNRGMKVTRVVLDYELKAKVGRELHQEKNSWHGRPDDQLQQKLDVARDNGLVVIDGSIQYPDLRIEYEKPNGELSKVDIELVTPNYSRERVAVKQAAGMKVYGLKTPSKGKVHDPQIARKALEL